MSLQRTPPQATLTGGSGGGSGSLPNLITYEEDSIDYINTRKRKERCEQEEYKNDIASLRADIMIYFKEMSNTQNENLKIIREEMREIKDEIKAIKSVTENFTEQLKEVNDDIKNIKLNNTTTQEKICHLEKEISHLKTKVNSDNLMAKSPLLKCENLIQELKDRSDREKNIIITGIPEKTDKHFNVRRIHDIEEFTKLATSVIVDCKYVPGKNRPLKISFNKNDTPKLLLQNRAKFPDTVNIYSDQTPTQKQYLQSVKEELKKRLDEGEKDLIIKYIKGIPSIIETKPNQKN
ncbi:hypothetical protein ABMA27_010702 [Loxostege sticticalis]|uniref:Uncharacterized protein n=1 Tax=Loxostege sticticalis TaxID=481309 RepID=A0ABR3H4P5_LOXSC